LGSEDAGLAAAAESGKAVESERRRKPPEPPLIGMEQRWSQRVNRRGSEHTRGPPAILRVASDELASESIGRRGQCA